MEKNSFSLSFLDKILARMKRADQSPLGHWQRLSHRMFSALEGSWLLRGYASLWRDQGLPIEGVRVEPAIKLDSVFFVSLLVHVLFLLLLVWVTVQAKPSIKDEPIRVSIIDPGKQASKSRTQSKRPSRSKAKKAVTKPKPKTRPQPKKVVKKSVTVVKPTVKAPKALPKSITPTVLPKPTLPAPKVLARSPVGQVSDVALSGDPLVKLPTTQATPAFSASDVGIGDSAVSDVTADLAGIPKELMQGKARTGRRKGGRSLQRADVGAYLKTIQARVKAVWKYPSGIRGLHNVSFSIVLDEAGKLVSVKVLNSTHSGLNASATEAVRLAGPYPAMPQDLQWLAGQPIGLRFKVNLGAIR
jgi:TonB family protein